MSSPFNLQLNIANPATGCQKLIEIEDERKVRAFYDKRISDEVSAESLGDEWKGYVLKITGGNDEQGFPMMQGVLTAGRVRLLLDDRTSALRTTVIYSNVGGSFRKCNQQQQVTLATAPVAPVSAGGSRSAVASSPATCRCSTLSSSSRVRLMSPA